MVVSRPAFHGRAPVRQPKRPVQPGTLAHVGTSAQQQAKWSVECGSEDRLADFNILQSDAELDVRFQPRLWSLIHNVPTLYEALLTNLAPCQLSANDLRVEGSGIGGAALSFSLFNFNVSVTIRLEGFTVRCNRLPQVSREQLIQTVDGIVAALSQAIGDAVVIQGQTVEYSSHGAAEGLPASDVIRRFTKAGPEVEGFGENNGQGAAFYYGEAGPLLSSVLTVDISRVVSDGIFLRVILAVAPQPSNAELIDLAVARVTASFAALDLQVASPLS